MEEGISSFCWTAGQKIGAPWTSPWVSSHINHHGNEVADRLAKEGSADKMATGSSLTHQKLYSSELTKLNSNWRIPSDHQWYAGTSPGTLLEVKCNCSSQTALARFRSGHLKCLSL